MRLQKRNKRPRRKRSKLLWNYLHLTHFETKSTTCIANGKGIYQSNAKTSNSSGARYARGLIMLQMYVGTTLNQGVQKNIPSRGKPSTTTRRLSFIFTHHSNVCLVTTYCTILLCLCPTTIFLANSFLTLTKLHPIMSNQQSTVHHPIQFSK